jgi:thiosulfate/3-mercaptopyruvate sulfurtransferase
MHITMIRRALFCLVTLTAVAASAAVRSEMLVSPAWLSKNLANVTLIEIGDPLTYCDEHIPGARLVPFAKLVTDRNGIPNELPSVEKLEELFSVVGLGDEGRIVIYSRDPLYAFRAWFTLDYLGHALRAAILDGGLAAWKKEGRAVTAQGASFMDNPLHAKVNPNVLATRDAVRQGGDAFVLIDARGRDQYAKGCIEGAVNVPAGEQITLKDEAKLRAIYTAAGVTPKTLNISYCRSGMEASLTYFVLKYLGYDETKLYDGSYSEWTA